MDDHAFCFILVYLIWLQVGSVNCGGNGKRISPKCTNTIQREIMQITVPETVATTSSHFFFLGTPHGPNRYILFFRSDQIPFMISLLQYYLLFISLNDCNVYYLFKNNKVRWKHTSHT